MSYEGSDHKRLIREQAAIEQNLWEIAVYMWRQRNAEIFFKASMIFAFQFVTLVYLMRTWLTQTIPRPDGFGDTVIKFSCLFSMHIMTEPQLLNAIERVKFILNHPRNFSIIWVPLSIAFMNMMSLFINEFVMAMSTIYESGLSISIVQNFASLYTISAMPVFYYQSLRHNQLKDRLEKEPDRTIKAHFMKSEDIDKKGGPVFKAIRLFMNLVDFLYETFYFHFLPYVSLIILFFCCENDHAD